MCASYKSIFGFLLSASSLKGSLCFSRKVSLCRQFNQTLYRFSYSQRCHWMFYTVEHPVESTETQSLTPTTPPFLLTGRNLDQGQAYMGDPPAGGEMDKGGKEEIRSRGDRCRAKITAELPHPSICQEMHPDWLIGDPSCA